MATHTAQSVAAGLRLSGWGADINFLLAVGKDRLPASPHRIHDVTVHIEPDRP